VSTRSKVKIPPLAARELQRDIDSAIQRRSVVEIRAFAREAELSGMDQEAQRAYEIADVIEAKSKTSARAELLRIKAALEPRPPSQSELVREFDLQMMERATPFSTADFEENEARRVEIRNAQLRQQQQEAEAQRARQLGELDTERPWQP
jgi:hypothetical protein